ncbi:MAG: right-handed parallel beta-helix repeat-containing protein, partial [Saprospiraceae bacterium]|nr:right-handed parallel beta-helix repeat-containing protein [Saprospiraceae bacterium]
NFLDWNVRGYSHGFYERGQDSAGILLYEQSSSNLIAFNSVTHSGDGLFLWAGQSTMDNGQGGCNDNFIYGNDFSHAPTNGIEVTFSRNLIQGNLIQECTYGIWGGYSYETKIMGNLIAKCKTGIAIEHGQNDTIARNLFLDDTTGINLWARESQPADWGYAQHRDVRSRDAVIDKNVFLGVRKPLKISNSQNISVNGENLFYQFEQLLQTPKPNEGLKFFRNDIYAPAAALESLWKDPLLAPNKTLNFSHTGSPENPYAPLDIPLVELHEPDSMPDGIVAVLPDDFPRGRQFIMVDEWGPFDFRRPVAVIDSIVGNQYSLALVGPSGDWKITDMKGVKSVSASKGIVPAVVVVERDPAADGFEIRLDYISPQAITTVFGEKIPAGRPYAFNFRRFEKKLRWDVQFFNYEGEAPASFEGLTPVLKKSVDDLYFAWWGSPGAGVQEDRFATLSTSEFTIAPGEYAFTLTSDDGVRLYLDGKLLIDHWNIHEPETDEVRVKLGGKHQLRIEHFEGGGFGTLGFGLGW